MMKIPYTLAFTVLFLNPLFVSANETSSCAKATTAPVTSVADLDANGIVNGKDIALLSKNIGKKKGIYSPLFDRNADGKLDNIDVFLATRDMNKNSTKADQELATISNAILAGSYTCVEQEQTDTNTNTDTVVIVNDGEATLDPSSLSLP